MALLGRDTGALAVGNALVGRQGSRFALNGDTCSLFAGHGPWVEQVQVLVRVFGGDIVRIGQTGCGVFRGKACNIKGGLHGLLDGCFRKVRRAGIATALADIDRHAQRLVAVAFYGFQLPLAHADAQAAAFGSIGTGIGGTQLFSVCQGLVHQTFKKRTAVAEAGISLRCSGACRACTGFVHSAGYDTEHCSPYALPPYSL